MYINRFNLSKLSLYIPNYLILLCIVGTILLIRCILIYSNYGIDFTDESFYLVWLSNPFIYDGSVSQFGFLYHPLYKLLNGNISALRQANVLITYVLAFGLSYFFLLSISINFKENQIILLSVSAAFASSALILFNTWLLTPSYNSLNFQALLITSLGLVFADKTFYRKSIFGWLLIGIGGWLVFMAKPSSAAVLGICVFAYSFIARIFSFRILILTAFFSFLLITISALFIDGSLPSFIQRLYIGIEFSKLMEGGYAFSDILRVDNFQLDLRLKISIVILFFSLFISLYFLHVNINFSFISHIVSIVFFIITALLTNGQILINSGFGQFKGLLMFGLFFALIFSTFVLGRPLALKSISPQKWAIASFFFVMPHIYAFGTNGNYWQVGSSVAIFWLLSGLTFLSLIIRRQASWLLALPIAFATQAVTALLLQSGFEQPYLQNQPLRLNKSVLEIGLQKSKIVLSEDYAKYFFDSELIFRKARFVASTPVIDLSGQSPGILYSIGAENIGQAWMIGGYPGSFNLAKAALSRISCEKIALSWVLFEHYGPRSISADLMLSLGADFPSDYESVGVWQTAKGSGGYLYPRTQELFKPVASSKTLVTCLQLRNSKDFKYEKN